MSQGRTVQELASIIQGTIEGNPQLLVTHPAPLSAAGSGSITFLDSEKNVDQLSDCQAAAIVVPTSLPGAPSEGQSWIRTDDPLMGFLSIVQHLKGEEKHGPHGVDPLASVHPSVKIGEDCSVHPFAVLSEGCVIGDRCEIHAGVVIGKNCKLADDVTLHPHSVLYEDTVIGNRVTIHAGTVLGADGFGYRLVDGRHMKIPQLGHVEIGDDGEIGSNTTVDRATIGVTRVGEGTKIDNLVMVAHNCDLGPHNLIIAQVGLAGSCTTGRYVVLAGQVGLADHLTLGDGAVVGAQSGVMIDIPAGERHFGSPSLPEKETKRIIISTRKLPEMRKELTQLRKEVDRLSEQSRKEAA